MPNLYVDGSMVLSMQRSVGEGDRTLQHVLSCCHG